MHEEQGIMHKGQGITDRDKVPCGYSWEKITLTEDTRGKRETEEKEKITR
jgi:hypothetical protein